MPKATRGAGTGQLRPHSRSSSATKLGANLQFTQKESQQVKNIDKLKKGAYPHEAHPTKPPFARNNSSQRVQSREQIAKRLAPLHQHQPQQQQQQQQQPTPKAVNGNAKGFSINNANQEEDDDDAWVSSESGAATPNHIGSDSDTTDALNPALLNLNLAHLTRRPPSPPPPRQQQELPRTESILPRVPTVRPSDFETMTRSERNHSRPATPPVRQQQQQQPQEQNYQQQHHGQQQRQGSHPSMPPQSKQQPREDGSDRQEQCSEASQSRHSPRPKHLSRPPSMHSNQSRAAELRPHPLIRGQSYGAVSKPVPLAPLTVVPTAALPQISTSPPSSISTHDGGRNFLSSSPTSVRTSSGSPASTHHSQLPFPSDRRSSFSSARSVNTIPVHSTIIRESPWALDRTRTFSTMSASSSSAALSSLSNIPNVTRPSSPQSIAFFPPVNPHANPELIHPLLPTPYLQNHLTILSRRAPIKESFDRVIRAKNAR